LQAGLTFLVGFGAVLWLSAAALGELRGPRAGLMRELNTLRAAARLPALRADGHLGRVAQQQADSLARGSRMAAAADAAEFERFARRAGWRGAGPVREVRLRAADPAAVLSAAEALRDPLARHAGVGLSPAAQGESWLVILLAP
jgi:hypothetical protein